MDQIPKTRKRKWLKQVKWNARNISMDTCIMVLYISFQHLPSLTYHFHWYLYCRHPESFRYRFFFILGKKERKEKKKNKESSNCPASNVPPPVQLCTKNKQKLVPVSGNQSRYMPPRVGVVLVPKATQTNACAAMQPVYWTVSRTLSQFVTRPKSWPGIVPASLWQKVFPQWFPHPHPGLTRGATKPCASAFFWPF